MAYEMDPALLDWLLDADPALRWQVERDLPAAPAEVWAGDPRPGRHRGLRRAAARAPGSGRPVGRRRVLPGVRLRGPRRRGGPAVDRDDLDAQVAPRLGPGRGRPGRNSREARREQPLGVRRPALLGRRGRLLHQRLDARQRRVARRGRRGHRPVVRRPPAGRRRLELRVGRGLDPLVVPLHAQLPEGPACTTRRRPAAATRCGPRAGPARSTCWSAGCFRSVDGGAGGAVGHSVRLPVPLGLQRAQRADYFRAAALHDGTRLIRGMPTRSRWCVPPAARRHLAAGGAPSGAGLVRGGRASGGAVEVADVLRAHGSSTGGTVGSPTLRSAVTAERDRSR